MEITNQNRKENTHDLSLNARLRLHSKYIHLLSPTTLSYGATAKGDEPTITIYRVGKDDSRDPTLAVIGNTITVTGNLVVAKGAYTVFPSQC